VSKSVFISYRRDDTAAAAGRVYDRLWRLLSKSRVFFDIDAIGGGEDFEAKIALEIERCDAVLIFIGQKWLNTGPDGQVRIWNANDYVRAEVRAALGRTALVLPILVDGAQMPRPELLPEEIRSISARNALMLRHESFDDDTEAILGAITGASGKARPWESQSHLIVRIGYATAGITLAATSLVAGALLHFWLVGQPIAASIGDDLTTAIMIGVLIAGAWFGWAHEARRRKSRATSA
jgi:hypothetical protein